MLKKAKSNYDYSLIGTANVKLGQMEQIDYREVKRLLSSSGIAITFCIMVHVSLYNLETYLLQRKRIVENNQSDFWIAYER